MVETCDGIGAALIDEDLKHKGVTTLGTVQAFPERGWESEGQESDSRLD